MSRNHSPDRDRIAADIAAFLARGGQVEQVPANAPCRTFDDFNNRMWNGEAVPARTPREFLPTWER